MFLWQFRICICIYRCSYMCVNQLFISWWFLSLQRFWGDFIVIICSKSVRQTHLTNVTALHNFTQNRWLTLTFAFADDSACARNWHHGWTKWCHLWQTCTRYCSHICHVDLCLYTWMILTTMHFVDEDEDSEAVSETSNALGQVMCQKWSLAVCRLCLMLTSGVAEGAEQVAKAAGVCAPSCAGNCPSCLSIFEQLKQFDQVINFKWPSRAHVKNHAPQFSTLDYCFSFANFPLC